MQAGARVYHDPIVSSGPTVGVLISSAAARQRGVLTWTGRFESELSSDKVDEMEDGRKSARMGGAALLAASTFQAFKGWEIREPYLGKAARRHLRLGRPEPRKEYLLSPTLLLSHVTEHTFSPQRRGRTRMTSTFVPCFRGLDGSASLPCAKRGRGKRKIGSWLLKLSRFWQYGNCLL